MKGYFTQCACVLLDRPVALAAVEAALGDFRIIGHRPAVEGWAFGGEEIALELRPDANGYIMVDAVDAPWPDTMGDPDAQDELFDAWRLGHFGPFAYPEGLARAAQQSWWWPEAPGVAARHRAFVRVRSTYTAGDEAAPKLPPNYTPLTELIMVTDVARALLGLEDALAYWNPNGEALRSPQTVARVLARFAQGGPPPLDLWTNQRQFRIGASSDWLLVDTVGMRQLDIPDHEALFQEGRYGFGQVSNLLLNVGQYTLARAATISPGDVVPGPAQTRWQARAAAEAQVDPPRPVLRWLPMDGTTPPQELVDDR